MPFASPPVAVPFDETTWSAVSTHRKPLPLTLVFATTEPVPSKKPCPPGSPVSFRTRTTLSYVGLIVCAAGAMANENEPSPKTPAFRAIAPTQRRQILGRIHHADMASAPFQRTGYANGQTILDVYCARGSGRIPGLRRPADISDAASAPLYGGWTAYSGAAAARDA